MAPLSRCWRFIAVVVATTVVSSVKSTSKPSHSGHSFFSRYRCGLSFQLHVRGCDLRQGRSYPCLYHSSVRNVRSVSNAHDTFEDACRACWHTTSESINPNGDDRIDNILQSLHSPAPQSFYVIRNAIRKALLITSGQPWQEVSRVVEKALVNCTYLLKPGRIFLVSDELRANLTCLERVTTSWSVAKSSHVDDHPKGTRPIRSNAQLVQASSVLALATAALDLVLDASEIQQPTNEIRLQEIVEQIHHRLDITLGTDIRGRTSVDTAFTLSLAGICDEELYRKLILISYLELRRVGFRPSRRTKDILHVVEKVAASGFLPTSNRQVNLLYEVAANSLASSSEYTSSETIQNTVRLLRSYDSSRFDLLSSRPMLWLWRHSSRLNKIRTVRWQNDADTDTPSHPQLELNLLHQPFIVNWKEQFQDDTLPLVVDVGCGLGTSLLGLASSSESLLPTYSASLLNLTQCNFVGGDLSQATLRYGKGIAKRWNLTSNLAFLHASAESLIQSVTATYTGRVALVLIQFPTPYRLVSSSNEQGNMQLPHSIDDGFMVSNSLMEHIVGLFRRNSNQEGFLLIQTNCEDVAIALRDRATTHGFTVVPADHPVHFLDLQPSEGTRLPERTRSWIAVGGERALCGEWSAIPLLPPRCATETEVACEIQGTPIHRCLLQLRLIR